MLTDIFRRLMGLHNEFVNLVRKILWQELPEYYSDNAIFTYMKKIYEYVYMRYKEVV